MADREDLLRRCMTALSRPGVNGFLGTAEIIEDLTLLGALDGKLVWGSMNRIGLQGASFEMDDRFGAYDADGIEASYLDGGKMLTRINYADPASAATLEASAKAIDSLSERGLNAMIEPFISRWEDDGRIVNDLSEEAVIRSISIAQALGRSSAHTWLKLPCVSDPVSMRRVMASTSLPSLILGGEVSTDPEATRASWRRPWSFPMSGDWSWAAPCSTRAMTTSRPPSTPPSPCCEHLKHPQAGRPPQSAATVNRPRQGRPVRDNPHEYHPGAEGAPPWATPTAPPSPRRRVSPATSSAPASSPTTATSWTSPLSGPVGSGPPCAWWRSPPVGA